MPTLNDKMFSGTSLMQLVQDAKNETKTNLENEETEIKLSFFLLVRKAFNDAYDLVRDQLVQNGKIELGESFSGITGNFVRGSYAERGTAYTSSDEVNEAVQQVAESVTVDPNVIDPEFFDIEIKAKPKVDAIRKYVKENRELPPGVVEANRTKSLSLTPTKEAKAFLEELNRDNLDVIYDLDIPEIIDEEEYGKTNTSDQA